MATQQHDGATTTFADLFEAIASNIEKVIQGKSEVVELLLLCVVAEGHLLIEDVPGVGKTTMAKALATSIDTTFGRVQFTPDLLPSDVVGVTVWDRNSSAFEFRPGPIFSNILLGDEINRATPKTQSALLEAMAEGQVTVDGSTYPLRPPFMVIATQNPLEHEGTYPLPDSQLDRFLMRISVGYPARSDEIRILEEHGDHSRLSDVSAVVSANEVQAMAAAARSIHVSPAVKEYLVDIADATRRHSHVALGMSPRASLALQRVARARAAASGRGYVSPDDVKALAEPVLAHRLMLTPEAQLQGATAESIVRDVIARVPVPVASRG
ncbi:MAG: MoxR family ATPase [Actinomycetota bacterium]|nr:MoxR family ATPase [Actinomycetota bacterium]